MIFCVIQIFRIVVCGLFEHRISVRISAGSNAKLIRVQFRLPCSKFWFGLKLGFVYKS